MINFKHMYLVLLLLFTQLGIVLSQDMKKELTINIDKKRALNDSVFITLTSFSHKKPYKGGATKATAYLTISNDTFFKKIMLSAHGTEGKSIIKEGKVYYEQYDSLIWKGYQIELTDFVYDKEVTILIIKK